MAAKLLTIFVVYIKLASSQYYGQSASRSYQPYFFLPTPTTPVTQPMYAAPAFLQSTYSPTSFTQPTFVSPTPAYASTSPTLSTFAPSTFTPPSLAEPTFALPAFPPMPPYPQIFSPAPTYPLSTYSSAPTFAPVALPKYQTTPTISTPTSMFAPVGSATPRCSPPTATAYYLTTALQAPKAAAMKKKEKETLLEKPLPPPTYPCPFCTGFANVPKNPKILPPPPCSSVSPGVLDKIPTIAMPDELKLKDLSKTPALISDLFEHKLSGKLRFDEDLLDGFLTGLGLGKYKD